MPFVTPLLKALLFLKIFKILYSLFGDVEKNGLIKKVRLISGFMTSEPSRTSATELLAVNYFPSKAP